MASSCYGQDDESLLVPNAELLKCKRIPYAEDDGDAEEGLELEKER